MIRVSLNDQHGNEIITSIPIIPKVGENIGMYIDGNWVVFEVDSVLLCLKKDDNSFDHYWIGVDGDFKPDLKLTKTNPF